MVCVKGVVRSDKKNRMREGMNGTGDAILDGVFTVHVHPHYQGRCQ